MRVKVKAGGAIREHVPDGNTELDLSDNTTLRALLDQLGIARDVPLMIIINDNLVSADQYASTQLVDGDSISLVQPIQAG